MSRVALLAAALLLGAAGCTSSKLEVREVGGVPAAPKGGGADGRVALGLSQLAQGNVGLALESFRRAAREDPNSHRALLGLGECYLAMGKPALARRSVEQALALRPDVPELYRALAAAAEGEGKPLEAAQLRKEAELRAAPPRAPAPAAMVTTARTIDAPAASSVTLDLTLEPLRDKGPRLVRLSMGEVALVTKARSPFDDTAPLADSTVHPPLRILNAARVRGIAAETRRRLALNGIREAEIGDWIERKDRSELRFAPADRSRARAIAARLPFAVRMVERHGPTLLLVGRDAAP